MFCGQCGAKNPDNGKYCVSCGAQLKSSAPPSSNPSRVEVLASGRKTEPAKETSLQREQRVQGALKELASAPLFLIMTIFFSVSVLFSLFQSNGALLEALEEVFKLADLDDLFGDFEGVTFSIALLSAAPGILIAVGLWITYASAVNTAGTKLSSVGMTIIRCVFLVQFIGLLALCAFLLMAVCGACVGLSQYSSCTGSAADTLGMLLFFMVGVMVFVGLYYGKMLSSLGTVRNTISSSVPDGDVSGFVAVMSIVAGSFSILAAIIGGFSLAGISSGVASILCGVQLFSYRNATGRISYSELKPQPTPAHPRQDEIPTWKKVAMEQGFGNDEE